MTPEQLSAALKILADAAAGAPIAQTMKDILALGLDSIPVDDLKGYLDDAARQRDDAIADAAEAAKLAGA